MPQKQERTDAPRTGSVPKPHLTQQLAQAVAGKTSAQPVPQPQNARTATKRRFDLAETGPGCHELLHTTELQVRQHLLRQADLLFSSLVVRRMNDGLCLQGVVETRDDEPNFEHLVREVAAVENVISQLVVRPRKG